MLGPPTTIPLNSHGIISESPRNALCLIEEIIVEEEFVLLYEAYRPSNLLFPHSACEKLSLPNKDPAECNDFRVEKRDIPLLLDELRVPPGFQCRNGTICHGVEGFMFICPNQY